MSERSPLPFTYTLFSDGGGEKQSAAAGACIVENHEAGRRYQAVCFLGPATNNEAELTAALLGFALLRKLGNGGGRGASLRWVCDSEYVLKSATQYIFGWQRNGWKTAAKAPVKNQGLWRAYLQLSQGLKIQPEHVRGHTGHPENEACDQAATWIQAQGAELLSLAPEDGVVLSIPRAQSEPWLVIDARDFLAKQRDSSAQELSLFGDDASLSSIEDMLETDVALAYLSGEGSAKPDGETLPLSLQKPLRELKRAQKEARALGKAHPQAAALEQEILALIQKYKLF